jgi:hypothetical protein
MICVREVVEMGTFNRLFSLKKDKLTFVSLLLFIVATVVYCVGLFLFLQGAAALGNEERRIFVMVIMWLAPFCGLLLAFGNFVALTKCFREGLYILIAFNFAFALTFVPLVVGAIEQYQGTDYILCTNMNEISDPIIKGKCQKLVWGFYIFIGGCVLCFLLQATLGIAAYRAVRQWRQEMHQNHEVKKLFDEGDIAFEEKKDENTE